jgi:predicted nucleotidyltransferase component of viral defense system
VEDKAMITRDELEEYSKMRGIKNIGHAEKDYFQNILLFIVYQKVGRDIIFKGGTALSKCYGMDRFSEDLDFSSENKRDISFIYESLNRFKAEYEKEEKNFERSKSVILRIKGPLYNGNKNSFCKLILDFSFREKNSEKPIIKTIGRFLEEIPQFDVYVMAEKEIFAEKARAIMTRNKARDVYDFWFLVKNNIEFDKDLADKKLKYYNKKFNLKSLLNSIKEKRLIWNSELSGLIQNIPDFKHVFKEIREYIKR